MAITVSFCPSHHPLPWFNDATLSSDIFIYVPETKRKVGAWALAGTIKTHKLKAGFTFDGDVDAIVGPLGRLVDTTFGNQNRFVACLGYKTVTLNGSQVPIVRYVQIYRNKEGMRQWSNILCSPYGALLRAMVPFATHLRNHKNNHTQYQRLSCSADTIEHMDIEPMFIGSMSLASFLKTSVSAYHARVCVCKNEFGGCTYQPLSRPINTKTLREHPTVLERFVGVRNRGVEVQQAEIQVGSFTSSSIQFWMVQKPGEEPIVEVRAPKNRVTQSQYEALYNMIFPDDETEGVLLQAEDVNTQLQNIA